MKPKLNGMMISNTEEWSTPFDLFERLDRDFGPFSLDPAATDENHLCPYWFNKTSNGLDKLWWTYEKIFLNPPYGRQIGKWIRKAYEESLNGCVVVCLLPARTDTAWFHDYVLKHSQYWFLRGRLKFGGCKDPAPFPSMIAVFRKYNFLAPKCFESKTKEKEVEG